MDRFTALVFSGHSPPGLYNLMKLNVRRSVFSFPNLSLVSITSSPDHQGSCCWMARAERDKRNAAKTPEAAAEARARRWRATLRGLVEEMVTGLPSARKKILCGLQAFTY